MEERETKGINEDINKVTIDCDEYVKERNEVMEQKIIGGVHLDGESEKLLRKRQLR